jgi:cyclic pyranopterin phosphate synthase
MRAWRTRYGCPVGDVPQLSHLDSAGRARMVDVGGKSESDRRARARAVIRMSPDTAAIVAQGDAPKGDVLGTARIAGIQAAKRTDELIPLAHPLPLTYVDVDAQIDPSTGTITFVGEARTTSRTGVEMEALTACAVAALTAYDMVKGIERGVVIEEVALLEKTGGKEDWRRAP